MTVCKRLIAHNPWHPFEFDNVTGGRVVGADAAALEHELNVARVSMAGEQAGAARKVFDNAIDFIKNRVQSAGRWVGGCQALKQMAADLLLLFDSANSAERQAARARVTVTTTGPSAAGRHTVIRNRQYARRAQ